MAIIRGYIAASLDGLIVAGDGSLDWLYKYDDMDLGEHDYRLFLKGIRTVVMGRATYDFIAGEQSPGPMTATVSSSSRRGRSSSRKARWKCAPTWTR